MSYNFDDFVYDAKKCFDTVTDKAASAVKYSEKQIEKAQLKGLLKEKYCELGKLCYDMHEKDIDYTGTMKKLLAEIKEIHENIKTADDELNAPIYCSFCGAKNKGGSGYCSKCGEKLSR